MIEIGMQHIVKNYGFKNILDGASLEIMTGDRLAIVGQNGSGKTTLLRIMAGEESLDQGSVFIRKDATIGYLPQIPHLPTVDTALRDVLMAPFGPLLDMERRMRALEKEMASEGAADALNRLMQKYAHQQSLFEAQGGYEMTEAFGRVVTGFGLEDLLDRPFHVLSGGQKTISMLAKTLLSKPDILLLDEPTNHLDIKTLEWFEETLLKYQGTVVIVSHDRYFLDRVAQKTVHLEKGRATLYHGGYTFSLKEQERQLLLEFAQYKTQQKQIEAMKAAIRRYRDWASRADNEDLYKKAKTLEKKLAEMEVLDRPQLEKPRIPLHFEGARTGKEALRLRDLSLSIGGLDLLRDVNLTLYYRQKACLLGDNGTGKTTLARAILGDVPVTEGSLFLAPSAKVGYIPQEIRFEDDKASVLCAFRAEWTCSEGEARSILAKYFFFGDSVNKRVSSLSGGEKVLLKLSVLVQREINFLLLDEPTNHIDIKTREMLEEALQAYQGTLLFISHDRYFIKRIATRIWAIESGLVRDYQGDWERYRAGKQGDFK